MFVSLEVIDPKPDSDSVKMLIDTGSILCIVENKSRPDTCLIKFRYDDLPAGLVKGSYEELLELIKAKK